MIRPAVVMVLVFGLISTAFAESTSPELASKLEGLAKRGEKVKDISADFTQKKFSPLLKKPMLSSGKLRGTGHLLRWDTIRPHKSMAMLDGQVLQLYFPRQKLLEQYSVDKRWLPMGTSPVPQYDELQKRFKIEQVEAVPLTLKLSPRDGKLKNHMVNVLVVIDEELAVLRSMTFTNPEGDRTQIELSNIKTNTGIKPEQLKFQVGKDVRVVQPMGDGSSR